MNELHYEREQELQEDLPEIEYYMTYQNVGKFTPKIWNWFDKKYANLVNKKTCFNIAKKINIKKFMLLGSSHKSLRRSADKIMSDCLEALIGAIYL